MAEEKRELACKRLSRREFVKDTSTAAAGMALSVGAFGQQVHKDAVRIPRVIRSHDANATAWDWVSPYYFDFIDQTAVDQMFQSGLQALTLSGSQREAWGRVMPSYRHGDRIAIKINLNNVANQSNEIDATAPVLNAVLHGLITVMHVPEGDIYVYDVSRAIPDFRIRSRVPWGVSYVQTGDILAQADPYAPIQFRNISTQYCPYVLTQAEHLIDLCLFKDHLYVLATMGMKNHFGTTRPGPANLHPPGINQNISDLNATPHIRDKTRLIVGDALFGVYTGGPYGEPQWWATFPGGTPNSIFLGIDPVATESVMIDYLIAEQHQRGIQLLSHEYLHDAMNHHGLGVHEHRDAGGNYGGIRYVELDLT